MWDDQVPALAEHFTLIRYDTRGHGESEIAARPVHARRPRPGRDRPARPPRDRPRARRRALAGRDDRDVARASTRPSGSRSSRCCAPRRGWARRRCGRERIVTVREQGTQAIVDTTLQRWLTDAYDDQHAIDWLRNDVHRHRRRGLRELLPRDPAHGPRPQPRRHLRPDAGDRRRPGPGDAAGGAREEDRRGHPRRAAGDPRRRAPDQRRAAPTRSSACCWSTSAMDDLATRPA